MDHTTERFLQIEAIFHEALAVPEEARASVIKAGCEGNSGLEADVYSLIEASEEEERLNKTLLAQESPPPSIQPDHQQMGPYKIDRLLSRGGMGAVYLAHRADGQYEQNVAVKVIDLPLGTEVFRERFRQERQILAELQHPYIARLLDGGVTARGDLYLVMEYVDGTPIHRYCEDRRLPIADRVQLFLRVCEAVQFAHQHFVVHRDLKPDNILVAEDGTPRLLDFGTAKLLSPSVHRSDSTLTREGYLSFTPQYASPEQVLGNPITSASDSYSLGVLLYLLVTGTLPYELKELTTAEMLRIVCEAPPRRPEHAVNSSDRLDADLEAILLKALRKEPKERYLTADQLASDLRACLNGLPVTARHGTLRYRANKFIHRNLWKVVAAILLIATLIAGVAGIAWQARAANEQRRRAESRSADLRQLSNSLLSELDDAIKQLPGSTGAQQLLVTRVLEHLDRMAKDAQGDRQTQLDLVDAYTRLGNLQGNGYEQNIGDAKGALGSLGKALSIARPLVAASPGDHDAIRALGLSLQSESEILWVTGRVTEAVPVLQEAVTNFDALAADPHASAAVIGDAAGAYGDLGDELGQPNMDSMNNPVDAIAAYRQALDLVSRLLRVDPGSLRGKRAMALLPFKIGTVELENDPAQAIKDLQFALQQLDAWPAAERSSISTMRLRGLMSLRQAAALVQLGRLNEALPLFDEDIEINRRFTEADPKDWRAPVDLESALNEEAAGYEAAADSAFDVTPAERRRYLGAAEKRLSQAVDLIVMGLRQQPANDSWRAAMADVQVRLGTIRSILRDHPDPGTLAKKGLATFREMAGKENASPAILDRAARAFVKVEPSSLRDPQFAVYCAERAAADGRGRTPSMLLTLAQSYRVLGQTEKSRTAAKEGLSLLPAVQPGSSRPLIRKRLELQIRPGL